MVHPSELLRSDSAEDASSFVAPVGDYRNDVDCGCTALPCLTEKLNLEKYAKPGCFIAVLSVVGFFGGVIVKYFRGTSQIWTQHYNIPQDTINWLIYVNEIFVGIFGLFLAYWGNRIHRTKTLGTLVLYFGVACFLLAIPEIYLPVESNETDITNVNGRTLCQVLKSMKLADLPGSINNKVVAFGILIMYQVVYALFTIAFITHGVTYIDDNTSPCQSPLYIALIFAAQRIGKQIGIYGAWMPFIYSRQSIFTAIVWLLLAAFLLVLGSLIAMFPKIMPNTLLRKSVNSLLSIASGNAVIEYNQDHDGFFVSLWRLLRNKILILSITAMTLMQSAIINFNIKEKYFNQVKYHVSTANDLSGYSDPALIQFSSNLLKQPLIAIAYAAVGLVIAKLNPKPKLLVLWNVKVFIIIFLIYIGSRMFNCTNKLKNELDGRLVLPYCSWNCGCSFDGPFHPVCLNNETHFSPCWAGCTSFDSSLRIYQNCSCSASAAMSATAGSCDADTCRVFWTLAQVQVVMSSALLGTTFITTLVIILRCVSSKDKALALGLYLTLVSLIPYLPVRAIYDIVAENFCQIWGKKRCQFYSEYFALYISIITLSFKGLAILVTLMLLPFIKSVELYKNSYSRSESDLGVLRRHGLTTDFSLYTDEPNDRTEQEVSEEELNSIADSNKYTERYKHQSDTDLDTAGDRSCKEDETNPYLSERELASPLKLNLKAEKSTSRTSNANSGLSTDSSLLAIANVVGDDYDSGGSALQVPQRVNQTEDNLDKSENITTIPEINKENNKNRTIGINGIDETSF